MNPYGISVFSIIPVRSEPSESSEMSSQLLFGELYQILEEQDKWLQIKSLFDDYEGWIDAKMNNFISADMYNSLLQVKEYVNQGIIEIFDNKEFSYPVFLVPGSSIRLKDNEVLCGNKYFYVKDGTKTLLNNSPQRNIKDISYRFLNAPYLWGGRSLFGIDCSGFTQIVFKLNGFKLPRDASQQVEIGKTIEFVGDSKTGDLAFFDNLEGNIIHVGIVIEGNRIIHASGKVRIDKLDHQGIFNNELNTYSHKLRIIKRIHSISS